MTDSAAAHDAYAAGYDSDVAAAECWIAEALFGLSYAFVRPGDRLLDLGTGTGLLAALFARAALRVDGMDFSPAMLSLCREKRVASTLLHHDLTCAPWPVEAAAYDAVACCGVFHFIGGLETIFGEAARVLRPGGLLAFTTKAPAGGVPPERYERKTIGGLDIFDHSPAYVERLLVATGFRPLRRLRCFVGEDVFQLWVARIGTGEPRTAVGEMKSVME